MGVGTAIYRIETPRLVLSCCDPRDAASVLATVNRNETHLGKWLPWLAERPRSVADQAQLLRQFRAKFDRDEDYVYAVSLKNAGFVGSVGLHRRGGPAVMEVGYWLDAEYCGQGFGLEMVNAACCAALRDAKIQRLEIHVAVGNLPSAGLAQSLGFEHEATLPRRLTSSEGVHDMLLFTLWRGALRSKLNNTGLSAFDASGSEVALSLTA